MSYRSKITLMKQIKIFMHNSLCTKELGENDPRKHSVSCSSVDRNTLLMREVTGEWPDGFELTEGFVNSNNHTLQPW